MMVRQMARPKLSSLPRFLNFHPPNQTYYYKNPAMARKANLGKQREQALHNRVDTQQALRHRNGTDGRCPFVVHRHHDLARTSGKPESNPDLSVRDQGARYQVWNRERKFSQNFLSADPCRH